VRALARVREAYAGARERPARAFASALVLLALMAVWAFAAHALWGSSVPSGLRLSHVATRTLFSRSFIGRSASYERLLTVNALLADVAMIVALAVYARRGHRLTRESAAGRIGTGMMLGMLGFAVVWLVELPFEVVAVWWERKHDISHAGYFSSVLESFVSLGGEFVFVSLALLVAMAIAGVLRRWWWAVAAPAFAVLALLSTFVSFYLVGNAHPLHSEPTAADVRELARIEGIPGTKADVQDVNRETTAPNAESVGFGPTRRVILWNTLLDGRFDNAEVRAVIAHELGHLAHEHPLKRVGWLALFLIPAAALVALATRRRGGLARPQAVPLALFVFVLLQLVTTPLMNVVDRREEAEADWSSLRATRDPAAERALFVKLATSSLGDPSPPTWSYVLFDDHPTIVQRVAMVDAWQARNTR
jgi:STE24 endopeptidase